MFDDCQWQYFAENMKYYCLPTQPSQLFVYLLKITTRKQRLQIHNAEWVLLRHQFWFISSVLSCLSALYKCTLHTPQPTQVTTQIWRRAATGKQFANGKCHFLLVVRSLTLSTACQCSVEYCTSLPNIGPMSTFSTQDTRKTVRNGSNQWTKQREWQAGFTRYSAYRHRWDVCRQCSRGSGHLLIGSQYQHYLSPVPGAAIMMLMTLICLDTAAGCPAPATGTVRAVCSRIEA